MILPILAAFIAGAIFGTAFEFRIVWRSEEDNWDNLETEDFSDNDNDADPACTCQEAHEQAQKASVESPEVR